MTLPYNAEELQGSPVVEIDEDGTTATRLFRLPNWDDWRSFAADLVGRYVLVGSQFHFVRPVLFPGYVNLIVAGINVEPLDPASPVGDETSLEGNTNRYPAAGAKLTVTYRTLYDTDNGQHPDAPGVPSGTYLTYAADLGVDTLQVPGRSWQYDVGGTPTLPDDVNPLLVAPTGSYSLTWHRVMRPPWQTIRALRGTVNEQTFVGAAPQTVLFLGARITRQFQFLEQGGFWKIRYSFAESAKRLSGGGVAGWNHFARRTSAAGDEVWTPIKAFASSPPLRPYAVGDFQTLFQFG